VIASDLPGIREALGSGAIYCEPWSVPAWIEAIHKRDDPAEYRRLSELAIRNAKEKEAEQPAEGFARAMEEMVRVHQKARAPVPQPARHLSRRERRMQVRA